MKRWRSAAYAFVFGVHACTPDTRGPARVVEIAFHTLRTGQEFGAVDARPIDPGALAELGRSRPDLAAWQRILGVYVGDTTRLPMLGQYLVLHDTLRFVPPFPPRPGVTYAARFSGAALYEHIGRRAPTLGNAHGTWQLAADTTRGTTVVLAAYPTSDLLPQNLLRIYLRFSAPMSGGGSFQHIRLYTDNDSLVENAFFNAAETVELWDADRTRLTLLFDPGRIKRNLRPNEEAGLPLQLRRTYKLVVDTMMLDTDGRRLARGFEKRFRTGPLDRGIPRVAAWKLDVPVAGTNEPLRLSFPEPLDFALLSRMIAVHSANGESVAGEVRVTGREREWHFRPQAAWTADSHYVEVDSDLEDIAGNSLRKLFDVAPGDTGATGVTTSTVRIAFVPRRR